MGKDPVAEARARKAEEWRREHDAELERRAIEKAAEREARRQANIEANRQRQDRMDELRREKHEARMDRSAKWEERALPINDPFTISQAERLGISPQEFLDLQAERQERARKTPSIAEQMKTAPVVGERKS